MAELLMGAPVGAEMMEKLKTALAGPGPAYQLAIVRMGMREDDLAYERAVTKKAGSAGIVVRNILLPDNITAAEATEAIRKLNEDPDIKGVLVFRPMKNHDVEETICGTLDAAKDIDGITKDSMAGIFTGKKTGFPPCTAEACVRILDHYGIDVTGKNAVVLGRSLVIGKPVAMLLLERNATVTICHSKTENLAGIVRDADIVIAAMGCSKCITRDFVREGQIVIDVGINFDSGGNLCGDVDTDAVSEIVSAITPVPGGVGALTTSLLLAHVAEAAERMKKR